MDRVLSAPENERIDLLYSLLKRVPNYLKPFNQKQFSDTPLHLAAGEGSTLLALEIQRLMPSFGKKLNGDGFSPLHVALRQGRYETVRAMIRLNPELISVQGREGITPLHYAAEMDDGVDILVEFLVRCPESVDVLTVREETAVHVAVKCEKLESVKVLVGWLRRKGRWAVLGWPDFEGNTVLHLAASTNQLPEVMRVLGGSVDVNAKNYAGLTTLDIVMRDNQNVVSVLPRRARMGSSITRTRPLTDYLSPILSVRDHLSVMGDYLDTGISHEMRSTGLVVSALIAAAAYQGVLSTTGLISSQTPVSFNITNITGPVVRCDVPDSYQAYNISKKELGDMGIQLHAAGFMLPTSCALGASLAMIYLLLPARLSFFFIHLSLFCLWASSYMMLELASSQSNNLAYGSGIGAMSFSITTTLIISLKNLSRRNKLLMKYLKVRDPYTTL